MTLPESGEESLTNPLQRQFEKIIPPFDTFVQHQISGGVILLLATAAALWFANSPYREIYYAFGEIEIGLHAGDWRLTKSLHQWVNDGLMALFFFILGLEIKRELLAGGYRQINFLRPGESSLRSQATALLHSENALILRSR